MTRKAILTALLCMLMGFAGPFASASSRPERGSERQNKEMKLPPIEAVALNDGERLAVVASTSIIADVVANVGGAAVSITVLIGPGQDPHGYEPTPQTLKSIEDAHLVFVNGLHLEEALMDVIEETARAPIVPVSSGIAVRAARNDEHHEHAGDPHFWMNPVNVMVWVKNVEQSLKEADPAHRGGYEKNARVYLAKLEELDAGVRGITSLIPPEKRKIVTDHDTFGYFADEYGFEIIGAVLPGPSTSAEPSAQQTVSLIQLLRREGIRTIFVGSTADRSLQDLTEAVAGELKGEVSIVPLLTGSLAPDGRRGDNYLDYIQYNVDQIVKGLSR